MARSRKKQGVQRPEPEKIGGRLDLGEEMPELANEDVLFPEGEEMSPRAEPRPIGETLAKVSPEVMEEINKMNLAINTHTGDVLNWASGEVTKLETLVKQIEEEQAPKPEPEPEPVRRWWWSRCWRWIRGVRE